MNLNDFATTSTHLTAELVKEERASPTTGLEGLQARYQRRRALDEQLAALESTIYDLRERFNHLPWLPDLEQVRWAQALLAFPNLAFLEVDTDGLYEDADILRLLLVDTSGSPLYNQTFKPRRLLDRRITYLTTLTQETLQDAPVLAGEWERITNAFAGRYIISFNLEFDQTKLRENAERYHLTPLPLIGACLMEASRTYFHAAYPKLATVCAQVGFPLPDHPHQDAFARIRGQIHLLEAIAQGITDVSAPEEAVSQDDDPC